MENSIIEAVHTHSQNKPNKVCIVDGDLKFTYKEYFDYIYGFCKYLRSLGISKDDHVIVRTEQSASFFITGLSIQLVGAIFVPVEKRISQTSLNEIIEITEADYLVSNIGEDVDVKILSMGAALEHKDSSIDRESISFPQRQDIAEVLFTTGTTGKSKGVVCSHRSVIAIAENVIDGTEMEPDNIEIIPGPYNHSNPLRRYYSNMYNGSSVVVAEGVTFVDVFFKNIEKNNVNSINLVPAFVSMILSLSKDKIGEYKDQLRYIQVGGAIFPQADKDKLRELLPHTRLYDFYGSTEAGCACTYDFNKYGDIKSCVGKPTVNSIFKFVDENGLEMDATEDNPGFLICGGAMVMDGYFKEPELTKDTVKNGYVVSKDLAYSDDEGNIYILGRKDDIINMGGNKIAPSEIEDAAKKYVQVEECACIPVKDKLMGEVPKLFITTKTNEDIDMKNFKIFLSKNIDQSKMPKHIKQLEGFPMTYNGKIKRRDLVDM